jgi:recombination protein RecA
MPARGGTDPLSTVLAQIEHDFGKGAVMQLGTDERVPIDVIDSGSMALNLALGIGGLPRGRIVEAYGPESSGKTSLALHAAASVQRAGGLVAVIDAEHALDPVWAERLGCDVGEKGTGAVHYRDGGALYISQPDTGEQGLEIADRLVRSGVFRLVIVDSVSALVPKAELEGDMGDTHVGLQARLMSQALRKMTGGCAGSRTTLFFINQLREKVGVMFGSPETTSGGKALKFYASVRLDVRRIETLKDGTEAIGSRVRVKVVKNKLAPPFRTAEFDFLFACGISRQNEIIDLGVLANVVKKSGAWYSYDGEQLGQGKEASAKHLREHPELAAEIEGKVLASYAPEAQLEEPSPSAGPAAASPWEAPPVVAGSGTGS